MKKLRSCVPAAVLRWWRRRKLDKIDRSIDVRSERTIRFLAAEEEQSACARRAIERAIQRPSREGRPYTRTDVADGERLERKLNWHQFKARQYIAALNKYSSSRAWVDDKRQVEDGVNDDLAEIAQKMEDLDKNPLETAMNAHKRDIKTAAIMEKHLDASKTVREGDKVVTAATDQMMIELTDDGMLELDELADEEETKQHEQKQSMFARIEERFAAAALGHMPPAPTRALLLPVSPPREAVLSPGARSKRVKGKQYAELVEEEQKSAMLEL